MADVAYTEGFPKRWAMIHRSDCTLLVRGDGMGIGTVAICAAPKLQQGEAWLETAKRLANGFDGISQQFLRFREASYCDRCGCGPPVDDKGDEEEHSRPVKTWTCDQCDHINPRPVPDRK